MKRIFGFFSVVLLLIVCLANAPPILLEPVDDQQEITLTIDQDQVIVVPDVVEITDYALPLVFETTSLPAEFGMLGMNYEDYTSYYAIQDATICNLNQGNDVFLNRPYVNRLHLAKVLNGYGVPFVERGCL